MATSEMHRVFFHVRRALGGRADEIADAQLLDRYARQQDQAAFADLVRRYGGLVFSVCRVLQDHHAAEDAFQAVFLVLARSAGTIRRKDSLGSWLFTVSYHTALRARSIAEKRRTQELCSDIMCPAHLAPEALPSLQPSLDEELSRLPERYRVPLVLCYLEGKTQERAARQLGWSPGALRGKLERGRELLRTRLARRGIALGAAALQSALGASAAAPPGLVEAAAGAALAFAGAPAATQAASATVIALAEGVLRSTRTARLKVAIPLVLALAAVTAAAGAFTLQAPPNQPAPTSQQANPANLRTTRSVILLWMAGGPSQIDTFDLKPGHPNGGPFKEIETAAKGVRFSEHLPQIARFADSMVVIRSMNSSQGDHWRGSYFMQTGYLPNGIIDYPSMGAVLAKELGGEPSKLPPFVCLGGPPAADAGFLDRRFTPAVMPSGEALRHPNLPALRPEEDAAREAYGRNPFGEGCLAARRLVAAGVPFVQVTLGGWDTHANNFEAVKARSRILDSGWAALMDDLKKCGLLDTTLVVWMGEFGRTPLNQNGGRDHWPAGFSVVLAGGGLRGGQAIGRTSADGTKIEERPVTAPELWATVCRLSGVDHTKRHRLDQNLQASIVQAGTQPINEVISPKNLLIIGLIHQLESPAFRTREQAAQELERFGAAALPALRRTAASQASLETTRRAQALVQHIETSETELASVTDKRWAALGRERHSVKVRIARILQANPHLDDRRVVAAVYLLTVADSPSDEETAQAESQLKRGCYHPRVLLDLAWELVRRREFNADLAGLNAALLGLQTEFNNGLADRLRLVSGKQPQKTVREGADKLGRLARTGRDLADLAFLVSLSRYPTPSESEQIEKYLQGAAEAERQTRVADVLEALIANREFISGGER